MDDDGGRGALADGQMSLARKLGKELAAGNRRKAAQAPQDQDDDGCSEGDEARLVGIEPNQDKGKAEEEKRDEGCEESGGGWVEGQPCIHV